MRYNFKKDVGQTITLSRFSPDAKKLFVAKGTIVSGSGYDKNNCNTYVLFRVANQQDFFDKHVLFGLHLSLVYGDYTEELRLLGKMVDMEVVTA